MARFLLLLLLLSCYQAAATDCAIESLIAAPSLQLMTVTAERSILQPQPLRCAEGAACPRQPYLVKSDLLLALPAVQGWHCVLFAGDSAGWSAGWLAASSLQPVTDAIRSADHWPGNYRRLGDSSERLVRLRSENGDHFRLTTSDSRGPQLEGPIGGPFNDRLTLNAGDGCSLLVDHYYQYLRIHSSGSCAPAVSAWAGLYAWQATDQSLLAECRRDRSELERPDGSRWVLESRACPVPSEPYDPYGFNQPWVRSEIQFSYHPAAGGTPKVSMLSPVGDELDVGPPYFVDLGGGLAPLLNIRGPCGAGPNCLSDLYRIDETGRPQLLLSDGYADLSLFEGHLLLAARASCCSWEYRAYPVTEQGLGSDIITVAVGLSVEDKDGADCAFYRSTASRTLRIDPPSAAWLKLCQRYGDDYVVAPADTAP